MNAFSIDIQGRALQPRAHIAEFFVGDDWKVSDRLTLNIGTRYSLNFPSTEANNQTAIFNLKTQVLDFPHTGRELDFTNFGPRFGLAYRPADSWVIRSGYGIVWFEQTGITTPFTLPQFPFVQTVGQQSQDNINPAFVLSKGTHSAGIGAESEFGAGSGSVRHGPQCRIRLFAAMELYGAEDFRAQPQCGGGISWFKEQHLGLPESNLNQLPASYLAMGSALTARVPNPYVGQIPASSSLGQATIAQQQLLRAYPRFTNVALFRDNVADSSYQAFQAKVEQRVSRGLTFTFAYTFSKLIDTRVHLFLSDDLHRTHSDHHRRRRRL